MFAKTVTWCFTILALSISCSVLKKDDNEDVKKFLTSFEKSINASDEEILKQFKTNQSSQSILAAIRVLQNKEVSHIICLLNTAGAQITREQTEIKVEIPINFKVSEKESGQSNAVSLILWLMVKENQYVITRFDAQDFYETFIAIKNNAEWERERKEALNDRAVIYATAAEIQKKYDSVVWHVTVDTSTYFYVVEGPWQNFFVDYQLRDKQNQNSKMGLVDSNGEIVIPLEYDLIGTISFDKKNIVEVKQNEKFGYFDITARQLLVPAAYDVIIPYSSGIIVKNDSTYGWYDKDYTYQSGFPNDSIKQWVENFEYLKKNLTFKKGSHAFSEISNVDYAGQGIIVTPSYLVRLGLMRQIHSGISTTNVPISGWTEYVETKSNWFKKVSEGIGAVVAAVTEHYIQGREEFYDTNQLAFVNSKQDTVGFTRLDGKIRTLRAVDSTLIEVTTDFDDRYYFESDADDVDALPIHLFFTLNMDQHVRALKSKRLYAQTQFIKLDSSRLFEKHSIWNSTKRVYTESNDLSLTTLLYMRNEILNEYGYKFTPEDQASTFERRTQYQPLYDTREEFEDKLSVVDKHNLTFLEKMIQLKKKSV